MFRVGKGEGGVVFELFSTFYSIFKLNRFELNLSPVNYIKVNSNRELSLINVRKKYTYMGRNKSLLIEI